MIELKPCVCDTNEQETIIQISRDAKEMCLWTSDNTRVTKMQKLLNTPGTLWKLKEVTYTQDGEPFAYSFVCSDKCLLTLRAKNKELTEEQIQAAKENIKKVRTKINHTSH